MPARDTYHEAVVNGLIADGWTITDDPLHLTVGDLDLYVDLGAEQNTIAAEKEGLKIAVEIKSFLSRSVARNLEEALGQYRLYLNMLKELQPDRILYLAIPWHAYERIFDAKVGQIILRHDSLKLIVFDAAQERIVKWIS